MKGGGRGSSGPFYCQIAKVGGAPASGALGAMESQQNKANFSSFRAP